MQQKHYRWQCRAMHDLPLPWGVFKVKTRQMSISVFIYAVCLGGNDCWHLIAMFIVTYFIIFNDVLLIVLICVAKRKC